MEMWVTRGAGTQLAAGGGVGCRHHHHGAGGQKHRAAASHASACSLRNKGGEEGGKERTKASSRSRDKRQPIGGEQRGPQPLACSVPAGRADHSARHRTPLASTRTYQCTCHPAVRCRGLTSDALRRSPPPLSLSHPQRLPSEQGPVSLRRCDDDHGRAEEEEDAAAAAADKEVDQLEEAKEEEDDDDDDTSQHWRDGAADAAPSPAHSRCCSTRGEQPVTAAGCGGRGGG
ncbi:unnamed protein product [Lampetra fluviatilis]